MLTTNNKHCNRVADFFNEDHATLSKMLDKFINKNAVDTGDTGNAGDIIVRATLVERFICDKINNASGEFGKIGELGEFGAAFVKVSNRWRESRLIFDIRKNFIERFVVRLYLENANKAKNTKSANSASGSHVDLIADDLAFFMLNFNVEKFEAGNYECANEINEAFVAMGLDVFHLQPKTDECRQKLNAICAFVVSVLQNPRHVLHDCALFKIAKKTSVVDAEFDLNAGGIVGGCDAKNYESPNVLHREGFLFAGIDESSSLEAEANYCLKCHVRDKDSCRTGLPDKNGCPLDQKISEMVTLATDGNFIAAIAVAMIDNPLIILTGDRICNDCSKACIIQNQTPVDIPSVESQLVADLLAMPWGFEIYCLLANWRPLNGDVFLGWENCDGAGDGGVGDGGDGVGGGCNVMVVGSGPSGLACSYYFTQAGCNVLNVDAMPCWDFLEPNEPKCDELIYSWSDYCCGINDGGVGDSGDGGVGAKNILSYGGIMQYGITNRWNKDYLLAAYVLLKRRSGYSLVSGVNFGKQITELDAMRLGFDHVVIATGCGSVCAPKIDGLDAIGVMFASDFLLNINLQQGSWRGAVKNKLTNGVNGLNGGGVGSVCDMNDDEICKYVDLVEKSGIRVNLPAVVIGSGLTAVDAATEALTFYVCCLRACFAKYNKLTKNERLECINNCGKDDLILINRAIEWNKANAAKKISLMRDWGGVTILSRKGIKNSASYLTNKHEVDQALLQGVFIKDGFVPNAVLMNGKFVAGVSGRFFGSEDEVKIDASTVILATGVNRGDFAKKSMLNIGADEMYVDENNAMVVNKNGFGVSFVGDANHFSHPFGGKTNNGYSGSVVLALASAKNGFGRMLYVAKKHMSRRRALPKKDGGLTKLKDGCAFGGVGSVGGSVVGGAKCGLMSFVSSVVSVSYKCKVISVCSPIACLNCKIGDSFRLQVGIGGSGGAGGSIGLNNVVPVSVLSNKNGNIEFCLFDHSAASHFVFNNIAVGCRVSLTGPSDSKDTGKYGLFIGGSWGAPLCLAAAVSVASNCELPVAAIVDDTGLIDEVDFFINRFADASLPNLTITRYSDFGKLRKLDVERLGTDSLSVERLGVDMLKCHTLIFGHICVNLKREIKVARDGGLGDVDGVGGLNIASTNEVEHIQTKRMLCMLGGFCGRCHVVENGDSKFTCCKNVAKYELDGVD